MALKTSEMPPGTLFYDPGNDVFYLKTVNGWVAYIPERREVISDDDMPSWIPNENVVGTVKT